MQKVCEGERMRVLLTLALEDFRDDFCAMCCKEINPHIRLCYSSKVCDPNENPIAEFEVTLCRSCAYKAEKNWKRAIR
jgi:hypothetical protein